MKELYLIRHGETELNRLGIVQGGGVDAPLNDTGHAQARAFYESYFHIPFDAVLTSALQRAQQTVIPFVNQGLLHSSFREINEMGWGVHEGKRSTPESKAEYQGALEEWRQGNYSVAVGGGESITQVANRLRKFFAHLDQRTEETLLICSHGRTLRIMMTLLLGLPLREMERFHHSNTGLYHLTYRGVGDVDLHIENDTRHLARLAVR